MYILLSFILTLENCANRQLPGKIKAQDVV